MKLRKSRIINKFYFNFFQEDYKNIVDGCNYVWTLLFAIISLPFSFITLPISSINQMAMDLKRNKFLTIVFRSIIGFCFEMLIFLFTVSFITHPIGFVLILLSLAVLILLSMWIVKFIIWYETKGKKDWETMKIAKEAIKSFKGKYCPKIEWID